MAKAKTIKINATVQIVQTVKKDGKDVRETVSLPPGSEIEVESEAEAERLIALHGRFNEAADTGAAPAVKDGEIQALKQESAEKDQKLEEQDKKIAELEKQLEELKKAGK